MERNKRQLMVFLDDLVDQSVREVCFGAAEYVADRANLNFEPWPLTSKGATLPTISDFKAADCLLLTERACRAVFGGKSRILVPHVFFLTDSKTYAPSVQLAESEIGKMAAEHLISRGYRNLACVASSTMGWSRLRAEGFRQACEEHRIQSWHYALPLDELPVYWASNFTRRHDKLHNILKELPKPCGIFAVNDVIAYFVIETARFHGIGVPHEVGIIGVDDDPVPNAAAGLAISSVQPPFREVGRQAASLLDSLISGKETPRQVILNPVRVIVRTSSNGFMVPDSLVQRAQAYIEERRGQPVRVGEVIAALRTTAVTLGKHFQRHLQITPADYILSRRIDYAKELLREGRLNVQQVSEECGFHSCSYFCQIFKQVTTTTPNEIRRPAAMHQH